jgi:hypothetical protein
MIKIDSRAAGSGKTRNGIYPRIQKLIALDQRVVIVVPSIRLQQQYQQDLAPLALTLINTEQVDQVNRQILQAIERRDKLIIVTHAAFKQVKIRFDQKSDYNLIIDEAFDPYDFLEVVMDPRLKFNIDQVFYLEGTWEESWAYWARLNKLDIEDSSFFNQSPDWKLLTQPNTSVWIDRESWVKIAQGDISKVYFGIELKPVILQHWRSVLIAAAAFEYTSMSSWMRYNQLDYEVIRPFEPHLNGPRIHCARLNYTKYFRQNNPEIFEEFLEYVEQSCGSRPCLAVKNRDESRSLEQELAVSHNAHGMNDLMDYQDIYLASSLNPQPMFMKFMEELWVPNKPNMNFHFWIKRAWTAYTFYQLIMRTSLRRADNSLPVNVYLLDNETFRALLDFFDPQGLPDPQVINLTRFAPRRPRKTPISKSEQNKRAYEKKKLKQNQLLLDSNIEQNSVEITNKSY